MSRDVRGTVVIQEASGGDAIEHGRDWRQMPEHGTRCLAHPPGDDSHGGANTETPGCCFATDTRHGPENLFPPCFRLEAALTLFLFERVHWTGGNITKTLAELLSAMGGIHAQLRGAKGVYEPRQAC